MYRRVRSLPVGRREISLKAARSDHHMAPILEIILFALRDAGRSGDSGEFLIPGVDAFRLQTEGRASRQPSDFLKSSTSCFKKKTASRLCYISCLFFF